MILASATNRFQGHFVADDEENSEEEEENEEDEESLEILPIDYDSEIEYNELWWVSLRYRKTISLTSSSTHTEENWAFTEGKMVL